MTAGIEFEAEVAKARARSEGFGEFLRGRSLSAGVYVLRAGGSDARGPQTEEEIYYVVRGRARFRHGDRDEPVAEGELLLVPAHEVHRFHSITEEPVLLVVFAPPYRAPADRPPTPERPAA